MPWRSASLAASVMVYAGRPKNSAQSPSPSPGTWSGRKPAASPRLSAAISSRTPLTSAGASRTRPRERPSCIAGSSQLIFGGR